MRIHDVFNVSLLNPVSSNHMPSHNPLLPPPVVVDVEKAYLVEEFLDSHIQRQKLEFLVNWLGYETPTWEPPACVNNSAALDEFIALHPEKP